MKIIRPEHIYFHNSVSKVIDGKVINLYFPYKAKKHKTDIICTFFLNPLLIYILMVIQSIFLSLPFSDVALKF